MFVFLKLLIHRGEENFDEHESVLFCAWLCYELSLPFISSSGITGSSDQFLLMLFCCHGYQVLQYAPWYCQHRISLCVLIDITARDHWHITGPKLGLLIFNFNFTKQIPPEYKST